jgi:hypothetical protein
MNKPPIKKKYIETPELFLKIWEEFKIYVDSNPDIQQIATPRGIVEIKVKKPYLRQGFEAFVYKNYNVTIHQYISNQGSLYDAYVPIVTHIRNEWEEDQISGTLTGRYKAPNLVARLNNIVEKTQTEVTISEIKADFGN